MNSLNAQTAEPVLDEPVFIFRIVCNNIESHIATTTSRDSDYLPALAINKTTLIRPGKIARIVVKNVVKTK